MSESWLRLAASPPIPNLLGALKTVGGNPANLLDLPNSELHRLGLSAAALKSLAQIDASKLKRCRDWLQAPCHHLICFGTQNYPQALAQLNDAPLALWADGGAVEALGAPQLALVGSRNPTAGGLAIAEAFAYRLAQYGLTITSGLAAGIDAASHFGALNASGTTVAVLGSGIDQIYPETSRALAARIVQSGLVISEYPPGTPVRAFQFPRRNRIIAGLTLGTLVIEANRRSGSLITARLACEYGREVFAIPGSIHSPTSKGCHKLLRDGAKLAEDVGDILEEIGPMIDREIAPPSRVPAIAARGTALDSKYAKLTKLVGFAPVTIAELIPSTGLTAAELSSMLLHLEMEETIEALPGGRYCRLAKRNQ